MNVIYVGLVKNCVDRVNINGKFAYHFVTLDDKGCIDKSKATIDDLCYGVRSIDSLIKSLAKYKGYASRVVNGMPQRVSTGWVLDHEFSRLPQESLELVINSLELQKKSRRESA